MDLSDTELKEKYIKIEAMLRNHGIYPTSQRMAIAKVLFNKNQHITADQIHAVLKQKGHAVSRATIYNTLGAFVRNGLLNEISIDSSCSCYDTNISHHHHFYNMDTGELIDISGFVIPDFDENLLPEGTMLEGIDMVIRIRNQSH